ncbi:YbjN domain-containing protein [Streptomyces sp. NPDC001514]
MTAETTEISEGAEHTEPEPDMSGAGAREGAAAEDAAPAATPTLPGQTTSLIPDQTVLQQLLDQLQLKHTIDDEGDLLAPWADFRIYLMFRGSEEQQVFSVRTFYDRPFPPEDRPQLLEWVDEWNQRTLWPKVCTYTPDDGQIRLVGEVQTLIGTGVDPQHFVACTVSWIQGSLEFDRYLAQRLGLPFDGLGMPIEDGVAGPEQVPTETGE